MKDLAEKSAWDELLDGLATAVIWVDHQQKVGYMNIAAAELLQVSTKRIVGVPWKVLLPGLVDDLTSFGEQRLTIHEYQVQLPDLQRIQLVVLFQTTNITVKTAG